MEPFLHRGRGHENKYGMKKIWILLTGILLQSAGLMAESGPLKGVQMTGDARILQADTTTELILNTAEASAKTSVTSLAATKTEKPGKGNSFNGLFISGSYDAMATTLHPMAIPFVKDYLAVHGDRLDKMKNWGEPYFNLIEKILRQHGLPEELKYLAVIESNLKSSATSWAGAVGPWQFMPETGRLMGLTVTAKRDDRKDLYRSTHAAAKYLKSLYAQLDDWLLVIAAYNGGPSRVESAIKKSRSRDFWDLQYNLPAESRNHVKKFIATHYVFEGQGGVTTTVASDMALIGMVNLTEEEKANSETLKLEGKYHSMIIAKNLGMDITLFNRYNPGFDTAVSKGGYELRLPSDRMELFMSNRAMILNESVMLLMNGGGSNVQNYPQEVKLPAAKKPVAKKNTSKK